MSKQSSSSTWPHILDAMHVDNVGPHLFRVNSLIRPLGYKGVWGGHLILASLVSAGHTVQDTYSLHVR
jgi:acyl-CoA thioesterase